MSDLEEQEERKRQDQEANTFALALLMPKELFTYEVKKLNWDLADEYQDHIKTLANKFKVAPNAVVVRIAMLKIF